MSIDPTKINQLVQTLLRAEDGRLPITPFTNDHPGLTIGDAYLIQTNLIKQKLIKGVKVIGWKAGFTSQAMRAQMGITEPNRGFLLDYMLVSEELDLGNLIHPRVEPEVAFVLRSDLVGPGITANDVLDSTQSVCPALEVVDSRFRDYKFRLEDNTADNSSAARVVLGPPCPIRADIDLAALRVVLEIDGLPVHAGDGSEVMGHPANSVAWLANHLSEWGMKMEAGQIIMSGGITAAPWIQSGNMIAARTDLIGSVRIAVTGQLAG